MSAKTTDPYKAATSGPSNAVWPGCGDGRRRWCGRVHDFGTSGHDGWQPNVVCWRNHEQGCPDPIPTPGEPAPGKTTRMDRP